MVLPSILAKLTTLSVRVYDALDEYETFAHTYVGIVPPVPPTGENVRVRRVHSITQRKEAVGRKAGGNGYARSGSFIFNVGVDYAPLYFGVPLGSPAEV